MAGVFILGSPRSGVNAVAALVTALGVPGPPPADLSLPEPADPLSGGESLALQSFHGELLSELGASWSAPPPWPAERLVSPVLEPWRRRARALFRTLFPEAPWAWGDHRLSLTFPFWTSALDVAPVVVLVHRHPARIAHDLTSGGGPSLAVGLAVWERTMRHALTHLDGRAVLVVRPDQVSLDDVSSFLRAHDIALPEESGDPLPKQFEEAETLLPTVDLSEAQSSLLTMLDGLLGPHAAFTPPGLGPETAWTELLLEERRRAEREQAALTTALRATVAAVEGLTPRPEPRPWDRRSDIPAYGKDAAEDAHAYRRWLERTDARRAADRRRVAEEIAARADAPLISVVVPVYRPDPVMISRCVASVQAQTYGRWELSLCDDASRDDDLTAHLESYRVDDPRILVARRDVNGGISAATNEAVVRSTGDFVALLDQDDELAPGALARVAATLLEHPDADLLYSDEDKLDEDGRPAEPFFKPDWSPDQLLSHMYLGHLFVVRRTLFDELGGMRSDLDGSQDYDLALRVSERAREVVHIPEVLYHWRRSKGSTAQDYQAKPQADVAARVAIEDALRRRGEEAVVESGLVLSTFRVRRRLRDHPLVSIVVPFRDGADLLGGCIESIHRTAGYDHWEALLVDNQSWEPETRALLQRLDDDPKCRLVSYPQDFNWSAINNWAATQARGDVLLFLNSDIEGRADGWLEAILEQVQRPEVGAVGARLLYPSGHVQHAGVVVGMGGVAWHAFCFCPEDRAGYFSQAKLIRNYSAVTGACMAVRRSVFDEIGGFDEQLAVAFNDIDFCLRLRQRGYLVVYTPFAELVHYEGATRGISSREVAETRLMMERWEPLIRRDPYFNPNLDARRSEHALPMSDEEVDIWERLLLMLET